MSPKSEKRGRVAKPKESLRYTPPNSRSSGPSPIIVPIAMFGFFALGCLIIVLNYFKGAPLLPGDTSNRNLLIGLGFITAGFITSTRYR